MKAALIIIVCTCLLAGKLSAQKKCNADYYRSNEAIEAATKKYIAEHASEASRGEESVIRIPVVVHILYHVASEKITDALVYSQIEALNKCYRHRNADSVNTPSYFKSLSADCGIEFQLAISDPKR